MGEEVLALPASGLWENKSSPGEDFHISHNAFGTVLVTRFTFTRSGVPTWYNATLGASGGIYTGPLWNAAWPPGSNSYQPQRRGSMDAVFDTSGNGTLSWRMLDGSRGSARVQRLNLGPPAAAPNITGAWYPPSATGSGASFSVADDAISVEVECYDAAGEPTWAQGEGKWDGSSFSVLLEKVSGTIPRSFTGVGSMKIEAISADRRQALMTVTMSGPFSHCDSIRVPIIPLTE